MATADELLSGASADNTTLVVDSNLRTIIIPSGVKVLGVASDDEVLRLKFKMPRYVSDTDLSTFSIRINYYNADDEGDLYTVSDAVVGTDDITFTWLVGPVATKVKGTTKFNICAIKLDSNGNIAKEFNTTIATLNVLEGLEAETKAVTLYSDVIEQWRRELFGIGDTEEANIIAVSNEQQTAIVDKGAEVLATIPEDYTETYNKAEESVRTKADAIVCSVQGETIVANDCSDDNLRNLRVFGKTTQADVPSPDDHQDLKSIENPSATIYGKNILEFKHEYNLLPENVTMIEELENGAILQGAEGAVPGGSTYSSGWYQVRYNNRIPLKAGQTVTLSFDYTVLENPYEATAKVSVHFSAKNSYSLNDGVVRPSDGVTARLSRTVTIEKDEEYFFTIGLNSCKVLVENIQLEFSDKPTPYEPYKPAQSITINHTLSGIPVSEGGNYTDANGQQWICDEVDFERGVYVQRVTKLVIPDGSIATRFETYDGNGYYGWYITDNRIRDGHSAYGNDVISDRFVSAKTSDPKTVNSIRSWCSVGNLYFTLASNIQADANTAISGASVYYVLATPIETPLTQEEIAAFKALYSNYPNTTVVNDANAWMELKYNADTEIWLDNRVVARVKENTPELGVDYFTEDDKMQMANEVLDSLSEGDKTDIVNAVLAQLLDGDEVAY